MSFPRVLWLSLVGLIACNHAAPMSPTADAAVEPSSPSSLPPPPQTTEPAPQGTDPAPQVAAPPSYSPSVVAVNTIVHVTEIPAGTIISATCEFTDENGDAVVEEIPASEIQFEPQASFVTDEEHNVRAARAGNAIATCAAPDAGLVDASPATFTITPGPASVVITELESTTAEAGETVPVECTTLDAYGNVANADTRVAVSPMGDGTHVIDRTVTFERTGRYTVSCEADGAESVQPRLLDVAPSLPASLAVSAAPILDHYDVGQVISIESIVTDRFGNLVPDAVINMVASYPHEPFGTHRFRFLEEGDHVAIAVVAKPTFEDKILLDYVELAVGGQGPSIDCSYPADGSMVDRSPNGTIVFEGVVGDANGITSVVVNGTPASLASNGTFTKTLPTRFGMNFVEITATDSYGSENTRVCSYLLASEWHDPSVHMDGAVGFKLKPDALDDHYIYDGLDSFNDLLHAVVNSTGLPQTLHQTLAASNPLVPLECYAEGLFGECWGWWGLTYYGLQFDGPHSTALQMVNGGLRTQVTLRNLGIDLSLDGTFEADGWVYVDSVTIDVTFQTSLSNGRPHVSVSSVNSINVSNVDTELDGFVGWIIDLLEGVLQDELRGLVGDALSDYISTNFNSTLDGVLSRLDVDSLATSFEVPRLDGGTVPVDLGIRFSSFTAGATHWLFGLGTRFSSPPAHARPSLGLPMPSGANLRNPVVTSPDTVGSSIHVGLLNHLLHALWRSGYFDATLDGSVLDGSLPGNISIQLESRLPPIAQPAWADGGIHVMFGGLNAIITYPGLFDEPITVQLGGVLSATTTISSNDLIVGTPSIEELHFSTLDTTLSGAGHAAVEDLLTALLQHLLDSSLNDGLPALPIPSFTLPSSVAKYNLPAGERLGLISPSLDIYWPHFEVEGRFGLLP